MELKDVAIDVDEFRRLMEVNKHSLDVQWEEQSSIYFQYVEISSACSKVIDELKDELNVLEAETDLRIRKSPETFGIEKVSEAAIKAAIASHKKVIKKRKEFHEWLYYDRILRGSLVSIEHRKRALTKLSDLYIAGYFAEPHSKGGGEKEVKKKIEKKTSEGVDKKLKKNKRMSKGSAR